MPAGDVNGEWTHDLHSTVNRPNTSANASLSSRITLPGGVAANSAAKKAAAKKKVARLTAAFDRMETDDSVKRQVNVVKSGKPQTRDAGMTIRGLAGPFAIMAQNFAPGTTAADIESAMTPIGGEMVSCEIVKTQPFIVVEMVFTSREGGEKVIETFNNQTVRRRSSFIHAGITANLFLRPMDESSKFTPSQAATRQTATHPFQDARSHLRTTSSPTTTATS